MPRHAKRTITIPVGLRERARAMGATKLQVLMARHYPPDTFSVWAVRNLIYGGKATSFEIEVMQKVLGDNRAHS